MPSAVFRLTGAYVGDVIALGQKNIRASAYKLQDAAATGAKKVAKTCVMVELTEL